MLPLEILNLHTESNSSPLLSIDQNQYICIIQFEFIILRSHYIDIGFF